MYPHKTTPNVKSPSLSGPSWWQDIFLLLVILGVFFSVFIDLRPLNVPDEARYSEIPREMVVSGDYVTPRLNTIKYFEKPALFYWIQASAIHLWGLSEWAVRLPTLLLAILGCLATYVTARILFDRQSGWFSALVLSTSILYFAMAHSITLDMTVSVFLTVSLCAFILGVKMPIGTKRNVLLGSMYAFFGLAVLTKGLVGLLLPAMIIGCWILLFGQWNLILRLNLFSGALIFLAITAPWHWLVQQANPEFFHFYFLEQQFLRYLTLYAKRYQPNWFFIPILILGFFPWVIFLFQALRTQWPKTWKERFKYKESIFLMLWAAIIFLFFSLSKSKLIPYILPVFPPLAMLVGHYLSKHVENSTNRFNKEFIAIFVGALLLGFVCLILPYFDQVNDLTLSIVFLGAMAACIITGTYWALFYAKTSIKKALVLLFSTMGIFLILVNGAAAAVDTRSIKPLAIVLKEKLKTGDEIVSYHHYYQDLPFYLQKRVTVVDCCGELEFGTHHQNTREFMIDDVNFWKRWQSNKMIYAVMSIDNYEELKLKHRNFYYLASTRDNVLVANQYVQ